MSAPRFKFDFDAVKGLTYEEGFELLFKQMEAHYNEHVNRKPTFVFGVDPATPGADRTVITPSSAPNQNVPAENTRPDGNHRPQRADTDTITPKTIPMTDVRLVKTAEGVALHGKAADGSEVSDMLIKGYDVPPYGPVVSGRRGRYNLQKEFEDASA